MFLQSGVLLHSFDVWQTEFYLINSAWSTPFQVVCNAHCGTLFTIDPYYLLPCKTSCNTQIPGSAIGALMAQFFPFDSITHDNMDSTSAYNICDTRKSMFIPLKV